MTKGIVIGGGPAGMFAAITAAQQGSVGEVTVQAGGHCVTLKQGQSLLAEATEETVLTVSGEGKLILTEAWY